MPAHLIKNPMDTKPLQFRCAACTKLKPMVGRRLRFILGLHRYVCADCKGAKK